MYKTLVKSFIVKGYEWLYIFCFYFSFVVEFKSYKQIHYNYPLAI